MVRRMMGQADGRIWAGVLIVMLLVGGVYLSRGMAEGTDEPMARALAAVGAEADRVTIDLWGRFGHLAGDAGRQAELADRIAMLDGREADAYTEERAGQRIARRSVGDGALNMAVAVAENVYSAKESEVCLAVRLSADAAHISEAGLRADEINKIGENFGGNIARNTCLRGRLNGKLKSNEKTRLLRTILAQLDARMITIQESDRYIDCTAYAPSLGDAVTVGGDQVNLHIVMRDGECGTDIYLGSPVIMMEY